MALTLSFVTHSEIGLVRKNNQDSGYASPHLLVVADGMGGAAAGDLASAVAVEAIRQADTLTPSAQMLDVLAQAVSRANHRIADLVEADLSLDGMGTTVTAALFDGEDLGMAHIGDSRAYLFRGGTLERLTHDHSWVQSLVDDGKIGEAEAAVHPHRSLLLKVLNGQPTNEPDLSRTTLALGDRLLFCSDGLCGLVTDAEIARALALPDAAAALERLVEEALEQGGIDNITVIIADVVESGGSTERVVLGAAADRDQPTAPLGLLRPDPGGTGATTSAGPSSGSAPAATAVQARALTVEDEARYNPQPPTRRRLVRPLVGALVLVLVATAGLVSAWSWTRTQYYVGAADEQVAIFQGLPEDVVVPLSRVYEVQPLVLGDLPPFYAAQVRAGIEVSSLGSARETVAQLVEAARRCELARPTPSPSPRPTATTTPRAAPTPATSAVPAPPDASAPAGPGC